MRRALRLRPEHIAAATILAPWRTMASIPRRCKTNPSSVAPRIHTGPRLREDAAETDPQAPAYQKNAAPFACNKSRSPRRRRRSVSVPRLHLGTKSPPRAIPCVSLRRSPWEYLHSENTQTLPLDVPATLAACSSPSGTSSAADRSATSDSPQTGSSPPTPPWHFLGES